MGTKKGFYFDQQSCVGCKCCQVACKDTHDLKVGLLFRGVRSFEIGEYPSARTYHYSKTCNHCADPACVASCPTGAMYIDEEDGTVQHDDDVCIGCKTCVNVCPYEVPQYDDDLMIARKCDACIGLRASGEQPACVASCIMRAIEFGDYDELMAAHPDAVNKITILPDPSQTLPCLLINARPAAMDESPRELLH